MRFFLLAAALALLTLPTAARADDASLIKKIIAQLNSDAKTPAGEARALQSISKSTRVPVARLQAEKTQTGWTVGDLYVAHAIAAASGKEFSQIVAARRSGQAWAQIAAAHNVSLSGGAKSTAKTSEGAKVGAANLRDRQQSIPHTSRLQRHEPGATSRNPADKWP
jgi:hypothetical protein